MPESVTPTLEQSAQKVAAYLADTIPQAGDFVIEQAPDVVRQIITLDLYRSLACALLFVIASAFVAGLSLVFRNRARAAWKAHNAIPGDVKWDTTAYNDRSYAKGAYEGWTTGWIVSIVCAGLLWIGVSTHLYNAIGPAFAPKAHLLQRIGVLK